MRLPGFPTTPADIPALVTVDELFTAYDEHLFAAVAARAAREPDARHAVVALTIGEAIVRTFLNERWQLVRDALAGGASADDAGAALGGIEVQEVAAGLTSWAEREHRRGRLTLDEVDAVIELIAGGARPRPAETFREAASGRVAEVARFPS